MQRKSTLTQNKMYQLQEILPKKRNLTEGPFNLQFKTEILLISKKTKSQPYKQANTFIHLKLIHCHKKSPTPNNYTSQQKDNA